MEDNLTMEQIKIQEKQKMREELAYSLKLRKVLLIAWLICFAVLSAIGITIGVLIGQLSGENLVGIVIAIVIPAAILLGAGVAEGVSIEYINLIKRKKRDWIDVLISIVSLLFLSPIRSIIYFVRLANVNKDIKSLKKSLEE